MNALEIIAASVLPALMTFFLVVQRWTHRLRNGELGSDWDDLGVFFFGIIMGVLWPLTLLWLMAQRPSRPERKVMDQQRLAKLMAENERQARRVGLELEKMA